MTEELEKQNTSGEIVKRIELADFKSMYYWLNAKPDTESKVFTKEKIITLDDLIELNRQVQEKLDMHDKITNITTVVVSLSNNRTANFGNWQQFVIQNWNIAQYTRCISINWDFNLKLPNYGLPQRHTMRIRIGSTLKPHEFVNAIMSGDLEESNLIDLTAHTVCNVDFISPVISNELFDIVSRWHDALPCNKFEGRLRKVLTRHHKKVEQFIVLLSFAIGATILYSITKLLLVNYEVNYKTSAFVQNLFAWLTISFITMYFFYIVGKFWGDRVVTKIKNLKGNSFFQFTKGDINQNTEIGQKNNKLSRKIAFEVFIAILVYILSLVGKFIIELIFKL